MTAPMQPDLGNTMPQPPRRSSRRRTRNFAFVWMSLTILAGIFSFVGLYLLSGSIGEASAASDVEAIDNTDTTISQDVVATAVPTEVAAIAEPEDAPDVAQGTTPVPGIGAPPSDDPAPAEPVQEEAPPANPTPVPTINPPEIAGTLPPEFEMGAHFTGDYEGIEEKWNWMKVAGMNWIKIQIRHQPGMDANDYGWQVQYNHENGFRILWGVVGEPEFLTQPGYYQEYAAFVARLAEIGSDGIEIWNEVNIDREWTTGDVDAADYTELLRQSYEAIKAVAPNTLVISAGLAPTGFFGGQCTPNGCDDDVYYQQMAAAGAAQYMDCVGAHYNEGIISPTALTGDPRDTDHPTRYLQSNTDRAYDPFGGIPVCYTELGYLTGEGYGQVPPAFAWAQNVTLAQQASWLATAALINAQSGKVRLMILWNLDYTQFGEDPHGGYGIIRPDGSCPACDSIGSVRQ